MHRTGIFARDWRQRRRARFFLDELFVDPEARGKGLGRAALDFVEGESRKLGARRICLEVELTITSRRGKSIRARAKLSYHEHDRHLMSKWLEPARADLICRSSAISVELELLAIPDLTDRPGFSC